MKDEKIVLTLSVNYVSHWTIYDALRELYQNIFDRYAEDSNAEWNSTDWDMDDENKIVLSLSNRNTVLDKRTLILGETTKSDNKDAIGNFGEGYKLAILVLLRNDIDVSIITEGGTWTFKLEHNEQFDTKMLTVYIEDVINTDDLIFIIKGIPKKVWNSYSQLNLKLQNDYKFIQADNCEILTDQRNLNKVFVGGLFVNDYEGSSLYGYNFAPHIFQLGRDRKIIAGWDANWQASKALVQATMEHAEVLSKLIEDKFNTSDASHVHRFVQTSDVLLDAVWNEFDREYPESLPIDYNYERTNLMTNYLDIKTATVSTTVCDILKLSSKYTDRLNSFEEREPQLQPLEVLNNFFEKYSDKFTKELEGLFVTEIMSKAENWETV